MSKIFKFSNGICLYADDLLEEQLARYQQLANPQHEPVEEHWFRTVLSGAKTGNPVFLDIGSALGYYSILVKKSVPGARVIAVDPNPQFHERFAATIRLNGLAPTDVELVKKAVCASCGTVDLALKKFGTHVVQAPLGSPIPTVAVEAVDLDSLLDSCEEEIYLAKMDIQGLESKVFEKSLHVARGAKVQNWIVGTHGPKIHEAVLGCLSNHYEIAFEDSAPPHQPDGIIVACLTSRNSK